MSIKIYGALSGYEADTTAVSKSLNISVYDQNGIASGPRNTYDAASYTQWSPAASSPTDVFTFSVSSSNAVISGSKCRLTRVRLAGVQSASVSNNWFLVARGTTDTGGTSVPVAIVPRDTNNPPSVADVRYWTANPTLGTTLGTIRSGKCTFPSSASAANDTITWDFDDIQTSPIYVIYPQQIAINFAGGALPTGLVLHASFTWTEE